MNELKLNKLANNALNNEEMHHTRGGECVMACGCSCYYANSGGSSTRQNGCANAEKGIHSPKGEHTYFLPCYLED